MSIELIHGDCLEVIPTLPKQSVHMVFADLPYGVTACHWDKIAFPIQNFEEKLHLCIAPRCVKILTAVQPFTTSLILALKDFRYDIVWHRKSPRGFQTANKRPMRAHETILVFGKPGASYNPQKIKTQKQTCYTPYLRQSEVYGARPEKTRKVLYKDRHPTTVLQVDESDLRHDTLNGHKSKRLHPTQKPVALLKWLIKTYTKPGDTVLDPVAGSGTTAIAAMRTGRKAICIEKDATYFAAMQKRVAEEQARLDALLT